MSPSGGGAPLPGEVRAALIAGIARGADAGLSGPALAGVAYQAAEAAARRAGIDFEPLAGDVAVLADELAHQRQELRDIEEALRGGFALDFEPPTVPGSLPGTTADVTVEGDLGDGKGTRTIYVRVTNLESNDAEALLRAVRDTFASLAGNYPPSEEQGFDEGSITIRALYQG